MGHLTKLIPQEDYERLRPNCKDSTAVLSLPYSDTVLTDGIPSYATTEQFLMNARLTAMRAQAGRNSSGLRLQALDMNSRPFVTVLVIYRPRSRRMHAAPRA